MNRCCRSRPLLAFMLMATFMPAASAGETPKPDPASVQAALAEAKARLKLSPEQEAALKPLMQERADKLKAVRNKYSGDSSRRGRRDMYREARPVMEDYQTKVREILDDTQEAEWEKMRAEARERLKEQYRTGRAPD